MRRKAGCCRAALFWGVASRICSRQHAASLCSSYLPFFFCVLLASMWCIHIAARTQLQFRRNLVLFYQIDEIFIMIDSLPIAFNVSTKCMPTSLEMLLLRYFFFYLSFLSKKKIGCQVLRWFGYCLIAYHNPCKLFNAKSVCVSIYMICKQIVWREIFFFLNKLVCYFV